MESHLDASTVRALWLAMPGDCKAGISAVKSLGLMDAAREEILAKAQASLAKLETVRTIDYMHALECAAEEWLRERGKR